jgi:hypothetical protein
MELGNTPNSERGIFARVILATGSYIGEDFDDARLDKLLLATPISWDGTLQRYVSRFYRLHDAKHVVRVYGHVDFHVLMPAQMYARRLKGYGASGYRIGAAAAEMSPGPAVAGAWVLHDVFYVNFDPSPPKRQRLTASFARFGQPIAQELQAD